MSGEWKDGWREHASMPEWMDERSWRMERRLEPIMLIAALLVIPSVAMEFNSSETLQATGFALNAIIWVLFAAEVVLMLAVVPTGTRGTWIRSHLLELFIVVLTPPVPLVADSEWVRALRLLRLLRLLHVGRLARRYLRARNIDESVVVLLVVVIGGGAAVAGVEPGVNNIWEGIWRTFSWATVGEDLPVTTAGRFIAAVILLLGIAFVSYITGAIAANIVSWDRDFMDTPPWLDAHPAGSGDKPAGPAPTGPAGDVAAELRALREEVGQLRAHVEALGAGSTSAPPD